MHISTRLTATLLILANLAWAGGFIANKFVLEHFSLWQVLLGRVAFAAAAYLLLWRKYMPLRHYKQGDWRLLAVMVACEPCLLFSFETASLQYTSASQAGMIVACFPFIVAIGAWIFYKESIRRRTLAGITTAVAGVALVSFGGGASAQAPDPMLGNALIFCAVLASSTYALLVKKLSQNYSFLFLSALQCVGGTLFFLPKALASPWPSAPLSAWAWLLYLGLGVTFFSYLILNYAISRLKAAQVTLFSNLIPVFTLLLAFVLLGERLSVPQYLGAALVLAGVFLSGMPEESGPD